MEIEPLKKITEELIDHAKTLLKKDGALIPVAFPICNCKLGEAVLYNPDVHGSGIQNLAGNLAHHTEALILITTTSLVWNGKDNLIQPYIIDNNESGLSLLHT